jgi:hypothetical protein
MTLPEEEARAIEHVREMLRLAFARPLPAAVAKSLAARGIAKPDRTAYTAKDAVALMKAVKR